MGTKVVIGFGIRDSRGLKAKHVEPETWIKVNDSLIGVGRAEITECMGRQDEDVIRVELAYWEENIFPFPSGSFNLKVGRIVTQGGGKLVMCGHEFYSEWEGMRVGEIYEHRMFLGNGTGEGQHALAMGTERVILDVEFRKEQK